MRAFLLVVGILALQPSSATFRLGQLSIIVGALGTLALTLNGPGLQPARGVLIAVGLGLKPQLAAAFFIHDFVSRRRKAIRAAVLTSLLIGTAAVFIRHSPIPLLGAWLANLRSAFGPGGVNSLDPLSPHNRNVINLEYPLRLLINNPWAVNAVSIGIAVLLAVPALRILRLGKTSGPDLLGPISLLVVVQLLCMYHREHDAVLLAIPLAWALSTQVSISRALPAILTIAVFFFLFLRMLYGLDGYVRSQSLSLYLFWRLVAWPYQTWALLALAAWLSYCCSHAQSDILQLSQRRAAAAA
jgi:hypothetical protein